MWARGGGRSVKARLRERPPMERKKVSLSTVCNGGVMLVAKRLKQRRKGEMAVQNYAYSSEKKECVIGAGDVGSRRRPKCQGEVEGATTDGEEEGEFADHV
ncbi:hypothetical protein GW17_00013313 [Ensete ventricosum]|nr:hypothetical protein GW17_00013313 [Ensete ventricosum]